MKQIITFLTPLLLMGMPFMAMAQHIDISPYAISKQGNLIGLTEGLGDLPDTEPGESLAKKVYDGSVYVPDSINGFAMTVINYSFSMGYIRKIRLPEPLTYLNGSFGSNLDEINIPSNLYYFYLGSFGNLDSIVLPTPVKENHVFLGWKKYDTDVFLPGGSLVGSSSGHYYAYFEYLGKHPYIISKEDIIFYDGVLKECYYRGAKNIVLPSSFYGHKVEQIHHTAFNNQEFEAVIFEEGFERIDGFYKNKISHIKLPASLNYVIGFNENNISELILPSSLDTIGRGAFARNKIKDLIIPKNVKVIERAAFLKNEIERVELPASLDFIGAKAFQNNKLLKVELPNGIKKLYESTFSDNSIEFVTLPQQLEYIGDSCFKNNQLSNVDIPLTVVHIAPGAFGNNKIKIIKLPQNLKYVSGFDRNGISEIALPSALDTIGSEAFAYNKLKKITIPEQVKVIEACAFFNNEIERVELPASLEFIGAKAFQNNQLSSVTIPSQVVFIGEYAFANNPLFRALPTLPKPKMVEKQFLYWKGETLSNSGKIEKIEQYKPGNTLRSEVRYTAVFED